MIYKLQLSVILLHRSYIGDFINQVCIFFEERWDLGRVGQIYRDEVSMALNRAHDHLRRDNRSIVKSHGLAFDEHFVMLSRVATCEPCSALEKHWSLLHLPEVK